MAVTSPLKFYDKLKKKKLNLYLIVTSKLFFFLQKKDYSCREPDKKRQDEITYLKSDSQLTKSPEFWPAFRVTISNVSVEHFNFPVLPEPE